MSSLFKVQITNKLLLRPSPRRLPEGDFEGDSVRLPVRLPASPRGYGQGIPPSQTPFGTVSVGIPRGFGRQNPQIPRIPPPRGGYGDSGRRETGEGGRGFIQFTHSRSLCSSCIVNSNNRKVTKMFQFDLLPLILVVSSLAVSSFSLGMALTNLHHVRHALTNTLPNTLTKDESWLSSQR